MNTIKISFRYIKINHKLTFIINIYLLYDSILVIIFLAVFPRDVLIFVANLCLNHELLMVRVSVKSV